MQFTQVMPFTLRVVRTKDLVSSVPCGPSSSDRMLYAFQTLRGRESNAERSVRCANMFPVAAWWASAKKSMTWRGGELNQPPGLLEAGVPVELGGLEPELERLERWRRWYGFWSVVWIRSPSGSILASVFLGWTSSATDALWRSRRK